MLEQWNGDSLTMWVGTRQDGRKNETHWVTRLLLLVSRKVNGASFQNVLVSSMVADDWLGQNRNEATYDADESRDLLSIFEGLLEEDSASRHLPL